MKPILSSQIGTFCSGPGHIVGLWAGLAAWAQTNLLDLSVGPGLYQTVGPFGWPGPVFPKLQKEVIIWIFLPVGVPNWPGPTKKHRLFYYDKSIKNDTLLYLRNFHVPEVCWTSELARAKTQGIMLNLSAGPGQVIHAPDSLKTT